MADLVGGGDAPIRNHEEERVHDSITCGIAVHLTRSTPVVASVAVAYAAREQMKEATLADQARVESGRSRAWCRLPRSARR
jgi:hypothetical protein